MESFLILSNIFVNLKWLLIKLKLKFNICKLIEIGLDYNQHIIRYP